MIKASSCTSREYLWHYRSKIHVDQTAYKLSGEQLIMVYDWMQYGLWNNGISQNYYIDLFFVWTDPHQTSDGSVERFLKGIQIHTDLFRNNVNNWIINNSYPQQFKSFIHIMYFLIPVLSGHYMKLVIESGQLNNTWDFAALSSAR